MKKLKIFTAIILAIICMCSIKFVKATDELPDDGAKITSVQIIQTKTGTGPWDSDDTPGNDSSEDNDIVRSFDQVTWTIENTLAVKDTGDSSYSGGKVYFEATIPDTLTKNEVYWNVKGMNWINDAKLSSDGRVLTGYYPMNKTVDTIPGKQTLVFVVNTNAAKNGTIINPSVKVWLNGNDNSEKQSIDLSPAIVSAAANYNLKIVKHSSLNYKSLFDLDSGNEVTEETVNTVHGRMQGYGIIVELYNESSSKGKKGIELPEGPISFDLNLSESDMNGTNLTNEAGYTPLIWDYIENESGKTTGKMSRNIKWNENNFTAYGVWTIPSNKNLSRVGSACYNGGNWSIEQTGTAKYHITISDYVIDKEKMHFPSWNIGTEQKVNAKNYQDNEGVFSSGYLEILLQFPKEVKNVNSLYLTVKASNFKATSISGDVITTEKVSTDNINNSTITLYPRGGISKNNAFQDPSGTYLWSSWGGGDASAGVGQKIRINSRIDINSSQDDPIVSMNMLQKFDATAIDIPSGADSKSFNISGSNKDNTIILYAAKPDGSNWKDMDEMNNTKEEELVYFSNIDDLKARGYTCVAVLYEGRNLKMRASEQNSMNFPCVIRNDISLIGKTYATVNNIRAWTTDIDYSYLNNEYTYDETTGITTMTSTKKYPALQYRIEGQKYVKTEYNDNGALVNGTHRGGYLYGNSILVIGAKQRITIKSDKVNYDISKNENTVEYTVSPSITNYPGITLSMSGITTKITVTIPSGEKYIPGTSNYGEPDLTNNSDGSTTLVWYAYDCAIGNLITPITFNAYIDEETENATQYTAQAVIQADNDKVGNSRLADRTATNNIQVINLSSHRLFKTIETPVIERNGEIHYKLSYKNNTDATISNFQLLDILPYNGDNRGTSYSGTYTLERIEVTTDSGTTTKTYYTNDTSARSATSKDTDLGNTWKETIGTVNTSATAFTVKGSVGKQGTVDIDIYLKTNGNVGLDKYVNSASAQIYTTTDEIATSNVTAQVIHRKLEGKVWYDTNANGIMDSNETLASGIPISLTDDTGSQVKDVDENYISAASTDKNGYYTFDNLPKGKYYVNITIADKTYKLTTKEVGINETISSKFNEETLKTDKITKLDTLDLPELIISNVNAGLVKKATKVIVNYKEDGTNTVLHDEVTIDGRIDDNYKTEDKLDEINQANGNKYEYVRVEGNTEGTMTQDTIYVTYYYQKKNANVKVLHVLEGTDVSNPEMVTDTLYKTEEITGRVDDSYTTQNRLSEINASSKLQYELVTDNVLNKSGNMALDTIYVVYEYRTIPAVVKVKHLEKDTNVELIDQETQNGLVGNEYTTQDKLEDINKKYDNKYELVLPEPDNKNGEFKKEEQEVIYYYQKKQSSIEVNYVEIGTNNVLADQVNKTGRIDEEYTTENKLDEINKANDNKYEFVKVEGNTEGKYTLEKQVITYYYQKKQSSIEVNYVEVGTNKVLADQVTATGRIDDEYTTENKLDKINKANDNKYEFVKVEGNAEGKYTLEKQVITYYYQEKQSSIEVNYVEVGTNKVLADQVNKSGRVDDEYTTGNKLDEINKANDNKYEFVKVEGNTEGKYTLEKQVITYYYQKKQSGIEVNYVEVGTNNVLADKVIATGRIDDEYTTENKLDEINKVNDNKYEFVKTTGDATEGVYKLEKQTITYWYQKKATKVVTKYIDINSNEEIYDSYEQDGRIDDKYTTVNELENINKKYNNIYEFVKSTENTEGDMTEDIIEVVYYYQKKQSNVKVLHVLEGTDVSDPEKVTDTLYDTENIEERIDDDYTTQNRLNEINNSHKEQYDLVSDDVVNKAGKIKLDTIYVIYEYRKAPSKIKIEHKDIDTDEDLVQVETRDGIVGNDYTTENKLDEINTEYDNKYELVLPEPNNKNGEFKREEQTITYYYQKKATNVIVKYVDIDTEEELVDGEELVGKVDDEYSTIDKVEEINENNKNKYVLVKTTENTEGNMTLDTIEVIYYYKKVEAQVIVKQVDEKTGEEIADREYIGGYVGDDYTTSSKEIDGYELVQNKIPENKDGKYEEETIFVTYYYNKIETPQTGDIKVAMYIIIALVSLGVISKKVIFKKI